MTGHLRFALLALASLLLLQFAAAQIDPAVCAESCRFVVVPSLGPAGPAGPPGLDGLNGVDGRDGLNGTDGANGLNGADGRDGLDGTNGLDGLTGEPGPPGASGVIDTSVVYTGLQLDSPVVTSGGLTISGGGISLPNSGSAGAVSLDHYEYKKMSVEITGGIQASMEIELLRIGRHVTLSIPPLFREPSAASIAYSSNAVMPEIPTQFAPSGTRFFAIPGKLLDVAGFICATVEYTGRLYFFGGPCQASFAMNANAETKISGWEATSVQWITA